ncbi:hypothetical protein, partial [Cellulosimicrobium cellulans]|uniref:hypothetical protein n=1 Tax=Cellulosimicrobium cellulans TaxID=1710 RepID=UPI001C0E8D9B
AARRADPLAADVAAVRYGDGTAWPVLADQWFASWAQARRVRALLDDGRRLAPTTDALQVTGTRASARFLRSQRELAGRLGIPRVGLSGEGHLFPLTRPDVVGRLVRCSWTPAGPDSASPIPPSAAGGPAAVTRWSGRRARRRAS